MREVTKTVYLSFDGRAAWLEMRGFPVTPGDIARFEDTFMPEPNTGCWKHVD